MSGRLETEQWFLGTQKYVTRVKQKHFQTGTHTTRKFFLELYEPDLTWGDD